jgi:hypothetical protein
MIKRIAYWIVLQSKLYFKQSEQVIFDLSCNTGHIKLTSTWSRLEHDHARDHDMVRSLINKIRANKFVFVQILFFLFKKIIDT